MHFFLPYIGANVGFCSQTADILCNATVDFFSSVHIFLVFCLEFLDMDAIKYSTNASEETFTRVFLDTTHAPNRS